MKAFMRISLLSYVLKQGVEDYTSSSAGFGLKSCSSLSGTIGVMQQRHVALLATTRRVAYELGLGLGKEVGFQVSHDKKIGDGCAINVRVIAMLDNNIGTRYFLGSRQGHTTLHGVIRRIGSFIFINLIVYDKFSQMMLNQLESQPEYGGGSGSGGCGDDEPGDDEDGGEDEEDEDDS
ncbi:hypothetical protein Tco_0012192 [Tanacetum coccineum]